MSLTATATKTVTEQTVEKIQAAPEAGNLTDNVKLSDLIRLGAMFTKPATGWGSVEEGDACALSAAGIAAEALGIIPGPNAK